jgi:acetyl esterase/lipase
MNITARVIAAITGFVAVFAITAAAAASPAPYPTPAPGSPIAPVKVVRSYQYAGTTDPNQSLTATTYTGRTGAPWVLTVHGGSWINGSQANEAYAASLFYARGWQTFNLSYRVGPDVTFTMQRDDIASARDFITTHAGLFHINPRRGTIYGFSAGGHLAAIGGNLGGFAAVVSVSGALQPQRFETATPAGGTATAWETYIGDRAAAMVGCAYSTDLSTSCGRAWWRFEPQNGLHPYVSPPTYVMYGTDDPAVPPASSTSYYYWLGYHSIPRAIVGVPGLGHTELVLYGDPHRVTAMMRFVATHTE